MNDEEVIGLKKESFHVVIFCLLLGETNLSTFWCEHRQHFRISAVSETEAEMYWKGNQTVIRGWSALYHNSWLQSYGQVSTGKYLFLSKSALTSRNLDQMKAWRKGLALLGLRKMVYEKSKHFHGLIFRKPSSLLQKITIASVREGDQSCLESLFFIPRDNSSRDDKDQCQTAIVITEDDRHNFKMNFEELPNVLWFLCLLLNQNKKTTFFIIFLPHEAI